VPVLLVTCWRPVKFWFRLPVCEGKMTPSVQKPSLKSLKEEIESSQEPAFQNHLSSKCMIQADLEFCNTWCLERSE
jgi:hypothetical protein